MCEFCGRRGRAVVSDESGRVGILDLSRGWSVAPYPLAHVHADGSTGDLFTCPACDARLMRGEALRARQGVVRRLT
ncbi:hypothetical protein FBY41_2633 [Humibacillus xanthopallidus]|uniref:Uncharacterized protein n=1 Tax=Humibacillus xanthopallidus TaxID=412689 RepID=A0A543HWD0_9MICO|nr:hypothetical protein FBY41_2633 [Humibacillus xanthopallidus]